MTSPRERHIDCGRDGDRWTDPHESKLPNEVRVITPAAVGWIPFEEPFVRDQHSNVRAHNGIEIDQCSMRKAGQRKCRLPKPPDGRTRRSDEVLAQKKFFGL